MKRCESISAFGAFDSTMVSHGFCIAYFIISIFLFRLDSLPEKLHHIFVNILLFQKSNNEYFLTLPIITCIITTLIARSFVPQRRSEWNVKTTKIVTTAFVISAIILIVISFILAFKLL